MYIKKNLKAKVVAALLSFFLISVTVNADPTSMIAGVAVTSLTANQLIEKADIAVKEGVAAANAAGVDVVTNVSESLNIALANFRNVVDDQTNKTIGELSKERQAVAFALTKSVNDVKGQTKYLVGFGDMALLSLEHTIDSSILGAFSGNTIVVQKILGRGQLESDVNNYNIGLIATNIGAGESNVSNDFELLIEGNRLDYKSNGTDRHKRIFTIENSSLKQYVNEDDVSNAHLTIKVKQTHHSWISWFDKIIEHDIDVNLSLYPKKAGDLVVQYDLPTHKWVNVKQAKKTSRNECHNCPTGRKFTLTLNVPGGDLAESTPLDNERLTDISCKCLSGSRCWYDDNGSAGAHVLNISPHNNIATCTGHHRTKPTEWVLSAMRQKYVHGAPIGKSQNIKFEFNKPVKVSVPKNAVSIRLIGNLITGESINVGIDPLSETSGLVVLSGADNDGVNKKFFLEIKPKNNVNLGVF